MILEQFGLVSLPLCLGAWRALLKLAEWLGLCAADCPGLGLGVAWLGACGAEWSGVGNISFFLTGELLLAVSDSESEEEMMTGVSCSGGLTRAVDCFLLRLVAERGLAFDEIEVVATGIACLTRAVGCFVLDWAEEMGLVFVLAPDTVEFLSTD